ncbi:hypothetical protein [Streptomyces sp. VRA16 Mangrove soil]|uniref:hypothetical protein n=1 Tax=Streptomyces sp. VRA16 Mangrove soil TaxID=2817434 RepID=UPI001A9E439A|nr:hypothetical protein [Streptomyces sp. VRA16 Mangrove soil]MBO1337479.1 hypothetical protein [Streptomyces sp. VRA16 Mangrove soil]
MEPGPPWWTIFAISAGVTVVIGATLLTVIAAVALGCGWTRRRLAARRRGTHPAGPPHQP